MIDPGAPSHSAHSLCAGCGYDLVGLDDAGRCPECTFPVAQSRAAPGLLRSAGVQYVSALLKGAQSLRRACLVPAACALALFVCILSGVMGPVALGIVALAMAVGTFEHIRGVVCLTSQSFASQAPARELRLRCRVLGVLLPLAAVAYVTLCLLPQARVVPVAIPLVLAVQVVAISYFWNEWRLLETIERAIDTWRNTHSRQWYRAARLDGVGLAVICLIGWTVWLLGTFPKPPTGFWSTGLFLVVYATRFAALGRVRDGLLVEHIGAIAIREKFKPSHTISP